jgi:hypothetical protein
LVLKTRLASGTHSEVGLLEKWPGRLPAVVGKGRVIRPLVLRFDAYLVVHSKSELLFAAEVNFRCLDGYMTEKNLDLVQLAAGEMAETRAGASQIVGALVFRFRRPRPLSSRPPKAPSALYPDPRSVPTC